MAQNSPTIIAASLDDKQMRQSIENLVNTVKAKTDKMANDFDGVVDRMNASLKKLGEGKVSSSTRKESDNSSAIKKETQATEDNTAANKKNAQSLKEIGDNFDRLQAALQTAEREVRKFQSHSTFSTDDIQKYIDVLKRVEELSKKVSEERGKMNLAQALYAESHSSFDAKSTVRSLFEVDDRLKQLNADYARQEKATKSFGEVVNKQLGDEWGKRNIVIEQMRAYYQEQERVSKEASKIQNKDFRESFKGALSLPATNIDEIQEKLQRLRSLLDEMKSKKAQGIVNISESDINRVSAAISRLNQQVANIDAKRTAEEEKANKERLAKIEREKKARLAAIEDAKKAEQKYQDNQLKLAYSRTLKMPTDNVEQMRSKLERLKTLLQSLSGVNLLSPSQIASAEKMIATLSDKIRQQIQAAVVQAQQTATRIPSEMRMGDTKSARDSFLAFMQGYKQQSQQLQQMIREAEAALDAAVSKRADELTNKINATKQKLNDLNVELAKMKMEAEKTGNYSTFNAGIHRTEQAIEYQVKRLAELRKQQDELSPNMFAGQVSEIDKLRAKRESILGIMKEEVTVAEKKVAVESRVSAEITRQIQSVNSAKTAREAFVNVISMPSGDFNQAKNQMEALAALKEKISSIPALPKKSQFIADIEGAITRLKLDYEQFSETAVSAVKKTENETKNLTEQTKKLTEQTKELTSTLSEKAQKNAQRVRDYFARNPEDKRLDVIDRTMKENGTLGYVYRENDARAKGLSIEQQLLQLYTAQAQSQQQATAQKESSLRTEQQITEEVKKRKAYQSPTLRQPDYYQAAVAGTANKLGIKGSEVVLGDATVNSINELSKALKQAQEAYAKLSAEERNSPVGKAMRQRFQEIERDLQKTRKEMSRPIDLKSALSGSEKTLDDIVRKMQRLQLYKQGIDLTKPNAAKEMQEVNKALEKFQKELDKYMSKSKQVNEINNALGRSWNYMKNRLAFYLTVGATTNFVKDIVDIRGQYELLDRSIGILIDSAQNGSRIFAELNAMAIKSPFTTMELGAAAKQLVAYDVAAKDVVDTTKRLADMGAAVGVPLERLTYALGQIKSYGYLNARDARMFANTGIPLVKNLADMYTKLEGRLVSTADVYDRIKKKAISYNDVMKVVTDMTDEGGKFFNFQEKAADTLKVKIANLTLAYNNMLNEMGKSNQGFISGGLGAFKTLMEHWRDVENTILALLPAYGAAKIAQLLLFKAVNKTTMATAAQSVFSEKLVAKWQAVTVAAKGATAASIGVSLATAGVLALVAVLGKLAWDYHDLKKANEEFNKSVADGAEENIQSISKFFDDYKKELKEISGASSSDQQKMWERMQEEIEKTIRNAQDYIDILNEIADTAARIKVGEAILQQQQTIEQEVKDLANKGVFDLGGGFAQDDMAEDLKQYDDIMKDIIKDYGNVGEAAKKASTDVFANRDVERFKNRLRESESEIDAFVAKLGQANLSKIMGDGDFQTQLANIRNFYSMARDYFLATEKGSKIGYEGQALLNHKIDQTIVSLGRQKNLFKDMEVNGKKYSASQIQSIEANRTAWEKFFSRLNAEQKKVLNYAVKTGQTSSDAVKEIWDTAAKEMAKSDLTAFYSIQEHIAQLRNTPDIVINIAYKERTEKSSDLDILDYEENLLTPKGKGVLPIDEYLKEEAELTKKYNSLKKKEGEDRVEWAKRVNDVIKDEKENLKAAEKAAKGLTEEYEKQGKTKLEEDKRYQSAQKDIADAQERIKAAEEVRERYKLYQDEKKKKKGKDEILEALKLEISLVDKLNADYDKLTKAGASQSDALATIRSAYGKTIKELNAQLGRFGLPKLDLTKILLGKDPSKQLEHFRNTLNSLTKRGLLNMERAKEVEAIIQKLTVTVEEYNFNEVSKGIEKGLKNLKEKFDLGVALDAEPMLGELFAEVFGLKSEELPRTFAELIKESQKLIDEAFASRGGYEVLKLKPVDIESLLDKKKFDEFAKTLGVELDSTLMRAIQSVRDNLIENRRKMISDASKDYDKLLEKYAEYQFQLSKIDKDAADERLSLIRKFAKPEHSQVVQKAAKITAKIKISDSPAEREELSKELGKIVKQLSDSNPVILQIAKSIEKKQVEDRAEVAFKEFAKNPIWKTAVGDLEGITHDALRTLIEDLEDFKEANNKLTDKQIKKIDKAIMKLHKQIRKDNPFAALKDDLENAKDREQEFEDKIQDLTLKLLELNEIPEQKRSEDIKKQIEELKEEIKQYEDLKKKVGKINLDTFLGRINGMISKVGEVLSPITSMLETFEGAEAQKYGDSLSQTISKSFEAIQSAGQGAIMGAMLTGNIWGAVIGGVASGASTLISKFSDIWSGNAKINRQIDESVRSVKRLEMAYAELEHQIEDAYGDAETYTKKLLIANKKAQLAEIQRQLALEKSRKSKNRDQDKILDLEKQEADLLREIDDNLKDIVNDLLGISGAKEAATSLVESMIDAFKNGEDYMKVFSDSFEDMIDSMIVKAVVGRLIADKIEQLVDFVDARINPDTESLTQELVDNKKEIDEALSGASMPLFKGTSFQRKLEEYAENLKKRNEEIETLLASEGKITPELVEEARLMKEDLMNGTKEEFDLLMDLFGIKFGQNMNLSNLTQGIQSITEDTAGAIEAYLNGVSQQVYLHSDLLTQIRDAVVSFDHDALLGVQAQMLLQLQNNYIIMQAMQTLMEGWTVPSGNGIRVALID